MLTLKHCTLSHRLGESSAAAAASITTTRGTLDAIVLGKTTAQEAMMAGTLGIEGDPSRLAALFAMFEQPGGIMFDVLTAGAGR